MSELRAEVKATMAAIGLDPALYAWGYPHLHHTGGSSVSVLYILYQIPVLVYSYTGIDTIIKLSIAPVS